jgi:DNA invertase Pin-like site-specific DNA recombinase
MGYMAQHEREEMLRRQKAGIAIAKGEGQIQGQASQALRPAPLQGIRQARRSGKLSDQ